jgi:GNAT superfamily N-acetyltransferase
MTSTIVREIEPADVAGCEEILRALPQWFGIEAALVQYIRDLSEMETHVAEVSARVVGVVAVRSHNRYSAEIDVIGVHPEHHRQGIGRALIEHVERKLRARSVEFLQVKTLGPSRPDAHYERTRRFYEQMGFRPLEENRLWGPANPCLIMIRYLGGAGAAAQRPADSDEPR